MASGWTTERRARQALLIKQWKPWERSTGATTAQGKAISSRNAYKGGFRQQMKELRQALKEQNEALNGL